jgi:hypothetical protein
LIMLRLEVQTRSGETHVIAAPRDEPKFRRYLYWLAETGIVIGDKWIDASEFTTRKVIA